MTDKKVVYSTRTGETSTRTGGDNRKQPHRKITTPSLPPAQQNLKIMRDKKGRRGKMVTVITGFVLKEDELTQLSKGLKTLCGAGGTVKSEAGDQRIEIQGDHRDKISDKLKELGYKVKFSGG